jgi:ferrous iron transport protein B
MLPPMAIFFPLFTLLEDLGYLPRIAFNLDNFFKKSSTCGKQCLTMCMGLGCNCVGVTGARIINSPRERLIAIITNSFVPCNGKFPTLIAISSVFIGGVFAPKMQSFISALCVLTLIMLGVFLTLITSIFLSKTLLKGESSHFFLELPPYRKPKVSDIIYRSIVDRTIFVLSRACVVAAPCGVVIWLLANVNIGSVSIMQHMATFLNPLGKIMGIDGIILLAFLLGLPANEIVLPIALMCYLSSSTLLEMPSVSEMAKILTANGWTIKTAICTMVFSLIHFPCSTTLLTIFKETKSAKWTFVSFILPTFIGFFLCVIINSLFLIF